MCAQGIFGEWEKPQHYAYLKKGIMHIKRRGLFISEEGDDGNLKKTMYFTIRGLWISKEGDAAHLKKSMIHI